jgi:uncharacterized protein (TIGR03084 family)
MAPTDPGDPTSPVTSIASLCDDLAAEQQDLDAMVAPLPTSTWDAPTPAEGWTIRDQVSHLAYFDGVAHSAVVDPERFEAECAVALEDLAAYIDRPVGMGRGMSAADLLAWWRESRAAMVEAFRALDPATRVPWFASAMSAPSFVTARLMEAWAHGQDVADALRVTRVPTDRIRHVAHIGVRALPYSFRVRHQPVPAEPVRIELTSPSGDLWEWGASGAANVVRGPALDFCLVVTQRRHPADTTLRAEGPVAGWWMANAQAFAGPPGKGRAPGQFAEGKG